MPDDSLFFLASFGAPPENHKRRDQDNVASLEGRGDGTHLKESQRLAPRSLLTALACARALLDQLETVIHGSNEERTRDVVLQVAEHLARVASAMTLWQADT